MSSEFLKNVVIARNIFDRRRGPVRPWPRSSDFIRVERWRTDGRSSMRYGGQRARARENAFSKECYDEIGRPLVPDLSFFAQRGSEKARVRREWKKRIECSAKLEFRGVVSWPQMDPERYFRL